MIAKKMKHKLSNITNFVDELHKKESHTNRKELIEELSNHLCEGRFVRLRNELKKLIWFKCICICVNFNVSFLLLTKNFLL